MKPIYMIVFLALSSASVGIVYGMENTDYFEKAECFETLYSANLELTDRQINEACEELIQTGEAFVKDFRDRGLIIKTVNLGDTVSIYQDFLFR